MSYGLGQNTVVKNIRLEKEISNWCFIFVLFCIFGKKNVVNDKLTMDFERNHLNCSHIDSCE